MPISKRLTWLTCAFFVSTILAQKSLWNAPEAYLGQTPPEETPMVFAPGLLADRPLFPMGRVAWSADGTEFYYAVNDSWTSGADAKIMEARYRKHHWEKAKVVALGFLSPTLSADGKTLYMRRIVKGGSMNNVWRSQRSRNGWDPPKPFLEESYGVYDYMPTASGRAYVGSKANAEDETNGITYAYSVLTMADGKPSVTSLGQPLNEPGFNGDLYVAPDESYMIVSARETKDYDSQLYISFRRPDGTWRKPVSLGAKINEGLAHRWGQYVTPDGKYLFYTHGTSEKDCAVYWVRFDRLLAKLRPK